MKLKTLAFRVSNRRFNRKIGQREAAAEIGVSLSTISRVENGKPCTIAAFEKLCGWLRARPAEFLDIPKGAQ